MPSTAPSTKRFVRLLAMVAGIGLLVYLVMRSGTDKLLQNAQAIGWGILLVLALAGVGHLVKTWAWRLTLPVEFKKVPFSRTLGLRLASEAIGQLGFAGQMVGDATRASLLRAELPASSIISSVALDRGLFMLTGLVVSIAGLVTVLFKSAIPAGLRLYAIVFAIVLLALLALPVFAVRRGWPILSSTARAAGRIPWFKDWLQRKESVILAAEQQLLQFHTQAPGAFWASTLLNVVAHALAIGEVYLILLLMGTKVSFLDALMLEALTKLINAAGAVIPGGVGAYEGGNMAIVKLVGLTGAEGLTLGLCRRFRSIVWAVVGGICLVYYSRSKKMSQPRESFGNRTESNAMLTQHKTNSCEASQPLMKVAIVIANRLPKGICGSDPLLANVGAVPLVLRAILSANNAGAERVIVAVDPVEGPRIRRALLSTRRLPDSVEWVETLTESAVSASVQLAAGDAERIILVRGDCSYNPSLYATAGEWDGDGALELTSEETGEPIGLTVLSHKLALEISASNVSGIGDFGELHTWIRSREAVHACTAFYQQSVSDERWQAVAGEPDRVAAERKLDGWLVKPTDGIFARMNRRVSIPISRQLIKYPVTPNMVTWFTLGVSLASGAYFGLGGYWNSLIGAALSLWASILDGCDGEVARLKLQGSAFGCWLDTVCDYLYYLFIFAGMVIGQTRYFGSRRFLYWGVALFAGAISTFIIASLGRNRMSGDHPEQYLAKWQKAAESHRSTVLIYIGRYTEFIIRRCFLPYALLALALLNFIPAALYASAIGANVAWIIALRSYLAFSPKRRSGPAPVAANITEPVTV